ncbi:ATP-binding cassette domain-containing protein [Paenibacillus sp. HB172176]|uniref:ABC transporter ATP-binding protein n=1 Tax=Paenibacillus sp. HB172176 TaxID=2493690 RepID=UPI00143A4A26|nr:ATP-binding cassette domain-containing protein [Paenibacillus sp. HB172176]
MTQIQVSNVRKEFKIARKPSGFWNGVRGMFLPEHETKPAVDGISFNIQPGEMIGFIGPNGAGKSTTIKMLTGILVPTSGEVSVLGRVPHKHRELNAANLGVVFGQRTQLWWDLPLIDSIELLKHVYKIPQEQFQKNLAHLSELLDIKSFLHTPVRQLSLGQRMRGDLLAALIHEPPILFLDEPTIGLDIIAKENIREQLVNINRERNVTVLLTTHDMADIEKICNRMIIIDKGKLIYDGELERIRQQYSQYRKLRVDFKYHPQEQLHINGAEIVKKDGLRYWFQFHKDEISASQLIARISEAEEIVDLTIEEPEIETIIKGIYQSPASIDAIPEQERVSV